MTPVQFLEKEREVKERLEKEREENAGMENMDGMENMSAEEKFKVCIFSIFVLPFA
jgi:hypothetical protein